MSADERILIVDDDEGTRTLLSNILTKKGYSAQVAASGAEAISFAEETEFNIGLIDMKLPDIDGIRLIGQLKKKHPMMDLILITGYASTESVISAQLEGSTAYIMKPIDIDGLLRRIDSLVERQHLISERESALVSLSASERALRDLFQNVPIGLYRSSADGKKMDANISFARMLGYDDVDTYLESDVIDEYVDPADYHQWQKMMAEHGVVREFIVKLRRLNGEVIWIREHARVVRDGDGEVLYYEGSVEDITDQVRAESIIREKNVFFMNVLNSINHPFYVINANDHTIQFANKASGLLNVQNQAPITCHQHNHNSNVPCIGIEQNCPISIVQHTKQPTNVEHVHTNVNGEKQYFSIYAYPIFNSEGELVQIIKYSLDITEKKRATLELQKYKDHLEGIVTERTREFVSVNKLLRNEIQQRKGIEDELRESEEKYRAVIKQSGDAIFLVDRDTLKIIEINSVFERLLGYTKKNLSTISLQSLLSQSDKETEYLIKAIIENEEPYISERRCQKSDGSLIDVELNGGLISYRNQPTLCFSARDISQRKKKEELMKRQFMKYSLEAKNVYFFSKDSNVRSAAILTDLRNIGIPCHVLSRNPEEEIRSMIPGEYEFLWLAVRGKKRSIRPDATVLESFVDSIPERNAILFIGLDYLVQVHSFNRFLEFVQNIREIAYLKDLIIILASSETTFTDDQVSLIGHETREIVDRVRSSLSEPLLEIMNFILRNNQKGIKPTYGSIGKALTISKPTLGKRMYQLSSSGHITIEKRGNKKLVELTNYGLDALLK